MKAHLVLLVLTGIFSFYTIVVFLPDSARDIPELKTTVAWGPSEHEKELNCLALNIYFEARSDSFAGKIAVSDVVLNRVESDKYPNTVCEVVYQGPTGLTHKGEVMPIRHKCQFSWYCDGKTDVPHNKVAWEYAKHVSTLVIVHRGITEGATNYHALYVFPKWANKMQSLGVIGEHRFYKQS